MFDPTIYENLKVVIEGNIYDLDLDGKISIIDRKDYVDLATMSRQYSISFQLLDSSPLYHATIKLEADSSDLYGEILEKEEAHGCKLLLFIITPIKEISKAPPFIQQKLELLWENRPIIDQQIYFDWSNEQKSNYYSKITLHFDRKINEDHISDFPKITRLLLKSLKIIEKLND